MTLALAWLATSPAAAQSSDLPNRNEPLAGITTAGQPNAVQLEAAAAAGIKSVIDLRGPKDLPVAGADGVTYANASALDKLLAKLDGPVLIHCTTGNRVGAMLALRAKLNGADSESALALGEAAGLKALKPTVEQKLDVGHD
jgi:protein tyrosine phosphatase (PTP) superfamily phosphohydrolase (DUF442 family)